MTNITDSILQQVGVKASAFSISSRYNGIATATLEGKSGEPVVYLKRRFVPKSENFFVLQQHTIKEGERLDNITNQYYGDPERFWQLCDGNNVIDPGKVTEETGDTINITLPEGIPGH